MGTQTPIDYGISDDKINATVQYIVGDDFWGNLSQYNFFIGPGIRLRGDLEYCSFMTSFEIMFLLNLDLCSTGNEYLSLRMICPISCKCKRLAINCPESCFSSDSCATP